MKKLNLLIVIAFTFQTFCYSQPCLPEGITFSTQAEIDNFQINYPNCTVIEGNIIVSGNYITNLNGLNSLTSVGGNLLITNCFSLQNLSGLENITSVAGNLIVGKNTSFSSGNPILNNISGLSSLNSVGGNLAIIKNDLLTSLSGLNNLNSINGSLLIGGLNLNFVYGNATLNSITALSKLKHVGSSIMILYNPALMTLSGLDSLSSCEGNLVVLLNHQITNFSGLDNIASIDGSLILGGNNSLVSLSGLENLDSLGGLSIGHHQYWTSFDTIYGNPSLTSLLSLQNLSYINYGLVIQGNEALSSLYGLDNINLDSISSLRIHNNPILSMCEVESICDYLASPNGVIEIHDNATGCNSQSEVEETCEATGVEELNPAAEFTIFPNPATNKIFISSNNGFKIETINIYNQLGENVLQSNDIIGSIDISTLFRGIYIIEIFSNELIIRQKLIIEE